MRGAHGVLVLPLDVDTLVVRTEEGGGPGRPGLRGERAKPNRLGLAWVLLPFFCSAFFL